MYLPTTVFGLGFSNVLKSMCGREEKPFCRVFSIPARKIILTNVYLGIRIFVKCEFIYETQKPTLPTPLQEARSREPKHKDASHSLNHIAHHLYMTFTFLVNGIQERFFHFSVINTNAYIILVASLP